MKLFTKTIGLLSGLAVAGVVQAADDAAVRQGIARQLDSMVDNAKVTNVNPAPVPGWYEVTLGPRLLYVSADAHYAFYNGSLMDLKENRDLSEAPRLAARASALHAMAGKTIDFLPKGKPEYSIYVFTDTDCAYCRRMHKDIQKITDAGIAVHYLAFPRAGVNSPTYNDMVSVWCSADKRQALTQAKLGNKPPPAVCPNPVKDEFDLGLALGVQGTPAVMSDKGELLGHYFPTDTLIKLLKEGGGS
ncbi:MAG TPA: DsbC family protein [Gammaproteobacteria bacterium]|nr:DsbC family protein [Gammaproteobacteria bacterium]